MALLYRQVNLQKWTPDRDLSPDGDFPCDCLGDLATKDNVLSFWVSDGANENLELIVVALAANRPTVKQIELIAINPNTAQQVGAVIRETPGISKCEAANHLHRDVADLSAFKLIRLANRMIASGDFEPFLPKKVAQLLRKSFETGVLDPSKLEKSLVEKVAALAGKVV